MKRIHTLSLALLLGGVSPWALAEGEGKQEGLSPEAFQEKVEANRMIQARRTLEKRMQKANGVAVGDAHTLSGSVRLEAQLDGMVILSRPINRDVSAALQRLGIPGLNRPPTFSDPHQVIYDGRRYWRQVTRNVPEWKLRKMLGQPVELEVQRFEGEGMRITSIVADTRARPNQAAAPDR